MKYIQKKWKYQKCFSGDLKNHAKFSKRKLMKLLKHKCKQMTRLPAVLWK